VPIAGRKAVDRRSKYRAAPPASSDDGGACQPILIVLGNGSDLSAPRQLVEIDGPLEIGAGASTGVGRLALDDPDLSRRHAVIQPGAGGAVLRRLGGGCTSVGGIPVNAPLTLSSGDLVTIGSYLMVYRLVTVGEKSAIADEIRHPFAALPTMSGRLALERRRLRALASADHPVLFLGPPGGGKKFHARALHEASRRGGAFVSVTYASLRESCRHNPGALGEQVRAADGGTLFLRDIDCHLPDFSASPPLHCGSGGNDPGCAPARSPNVRIMASSSRTDIGERELGLLREKLGRHFRETVLIPPLESRQEDVGALAYQFIAPRKMGIESAALLALLRHRWSGNVPELQQVVRCAGRTAGSDQTLRLRHLPEYLFSVSAGALEKNASTGPVQQAIAEAMGKGLSPLTVGDAAAEMGRRYGLSNRQMDIVTRLGLGLRIKSIAVELGLDRRTVTEQVARACARAGVRDREALAGRLVEILLELANRSLRPQD
jgi:DNA-binding CsgD family transcriptional regulator